MSNKINAGFPAYGTAAAQAANQTFSKEWQKKTEETTNTSNAKAATYEKGASASNAESYDKTGKATSAASSSAATNTQTTVTGTPTGQVSGFARAGAVLNHNDYGKVVGEPKLSEEGAKYYNELKKKFRGMDFVLVGRDSVQTAKQQQNSYANGNRLVVLIDEDKIEQMAKDPKFRNYYEGIIKQAQSGQFAQAQAQARVAPKFNAGSDKKGPNVLDNGARGFLAASAKANKEFAKKTAKMREKKRAEKKAEEKKEKKRTEEARRKERAEEGREEKQEARVKERKVYHSAELRYSHEELAKRPENLGRQQLEEIKPEGKPEGKFVDFRA